MSEPSYRDERAAIARSLVEARLLREEDAATQRRRRRGRWLIIIIVGVVAGTGGVFASIQAFRWFSRVSYAVLGGG